MLVLLHLQWQARELLWQPLQLPMQLRQLLLPLVLSFTCSWHRCCAVNAHEEGASYARSGFVEPVLGDISEASLSGSAFEEH